MCHVPTRRGEGKDGSRQSSRQRFLVIKDEMMCGQPFTGYVRTASQISSSRIITFGQSNKGGTWQVAALETHFRELLI
jgi:hypothetical protein